MIALLSPPWSVLAFWFQNIHFSQYVRLYFSSKTEANPSHLFHIPSPLPTTSNKVSFNLRHLSALFLFLHVHYHYILLNILSPSFPLSNLPLIHSVIWNLEYLWLCTKWCLCSLPWHSLAQNHFSGLSSYHPTPPPPLQTSGHIPERIRSARAFAQTFPFTKHHPFPLLVPLINS